MATRPWQVLLICGASGSGKTSISYRLAQHFQVGITEVDDFHAVLQRMTTQEAQPELHYWRTHPEAVHDAPEETVQRLIALSRVMAPALEAVIANRLESNVPVVLEGDFILPALATKAMFEGQANAGRVRAVVIDEPDEDQFLRNYQARESASQPNRARVSWLHAQWLRREADACGVPIVSSRPWPTLFERMLHVIAQEDPD